MSRLVSLSIIILTLVCQTQRIGAQDAVAGGQDAARAAGVLDTGLFRWRVSEPLLAVDPRRLPDGGEHPWVSVKDPSIVQHNGRWHLFCTLRRAKQGDGRIRIGYLSFADWSEASKSNWSILDLTLGYHGAPQIFYYTPHKLWYLIYQAEDQTRDLKYGPCYSTNANINDPRSWTLPETMFEFKEGVKAGLDYWVICDDEKAYLFLTTNDGRMWRAETELARFPNSGWSEPVVALQDDIFEASHTYKLLGQDKYFTIIEAQAEKRRYFKGYLAEKLDGPWRPLAASHEKPLVAVQNVVNQSQSWSTSYSHGEFIRVGIDQRMEIEPLNFQLLFQGVNDHEYQRGYADIPWRLGLLSAE